MMLIIEASRRRLAGPRSAPVTSTRPRGLYNNSLADWRAGRFALHRQQLASGFAAARDRNPPLRLETRLTRKPRHIAEGEGQSPRPPRSRTC